MLLLRGVCMPGNRCRCPFWCQQMFFRSCIWQISTGIRSRWCRDSHSDLFRLKFQPLNFWCNLKLRLVGWQWFSLAQRRERGSRKLAHEPLVGQRCVTCLFAISVSFSFRSVMMGCLHEHDQPGRCCIAKFHAIPFSDASSFSRHGHAESLTLVVGLQSEPKLWPW